MDANNANHLDEPIALEEIFRLRNKLPMHLTSKDACHAFEIYKVRNAMVREAAYFLAQARGFAPGQEEQDWLLAEHDVDARVFAELAPVGFVG